MPDNYPVICKKSETVIKMTIAINVVLVVLIIAVVAFLVQNMKEGYSNDANVQQISAQVYSQLKPLLVDQSQYYMPIPSAVSAQDVLEVKSGVNVVNNDPGPLIQKKYHNNEADRYGVAQIPGGKTHLYAANSFGPSEVHMSFATGQNTYDSVIIANKDKATGAKKATVHGKLDVVTTQGSESNRAALCVDGACITGDHQGGKLGRMHVNPRELLYLLPQKGTMVTADWGATPTINMHSGAGKTAQLCIDNQCITASDITKLKSMR